MMSHAGMMMPEPAIDPLAEAVERISQCNYKFVQTMATERKLPANLKKQDIARLIALYDVGAELELNRLLSSLKETRSKTRKPNAPRERRSHGGGGERSAAGVLTAEADSASASPDLEDDDEELYSPMAAEDDHDHDGDEDYEPSTSKRPRSIKHASAAVSYGQQCRRSSYDMAASPPQVHQVPLPTLGMAPAAALGASRPQPPAAPGPGPGPAPGQAPNRMAWSEEAARRAMGSGGAHAMKSHPARMSKTGRVIKPRRDGSYVYAKMPHHQNSMSYPPAASPSPVYRQSSTLEAGAFNSPPVASQPDGFRVASPYGHAPSASASVPVTASPFIENNSILTKQWPVSEQPPVPSLQPISNNSFSKNVTSDVFKPYNRQHTQPKVNSPSAYSYHQQEGYAEHSYVRANQSYLKQQRLSSEDAPLQLPPPPPAQVVRPIPLPAAPSNNFSSNLEWIVNMKSGNLQMPVQLSPYWKPANTNSVNSYLTPISFTSSVFQDPSRSLIQPYMPPISSNPLYSQPSLHPDSLKHSRLYKPELQMPASAQYEILQLQHQAPFLGSFQANPPPLIHTTSMPPIPPLEHYRPSFVSPTNQYQDHQNWQPQQQLEPWMQETGEEKYHSPQTVKKQQKLVQSESMQKPQMMQQKPKNQHQQYQSLPPTRQTHLQRQEKQTSFQGYSSAQQHLAVAPVKGLRTASIPFKSQSMHSQSRRQTKIITPHSLSSNHHSTYQQRSSCNRQPAHHMQRSTHPTYVDNHQPTMGEHAQGPARKKPCYQPNQASQQKVISEKRMLNQVSLNQAGPQGHQVDVPNIIPLPNPEFCENNEISMNLIFNYLTSAEKQQLEPIVSKPGRYPESSRNENPYNFPTELPVTSQKSFESTINGSSSYMEEVIPSLTQHVLHSEDVLNSKLSSVTLPHTVSSLSLSCPSVPCSTMEDAARKFVGVVPVPQENSTYGNSQQVYSPVGRVEHDGTNALDIQNMDSSSYSNFAAVIVENVHSIQQFESQDYAQLVPVPVECSRSNDDSESHRDMQLRLIKALADPSSSPSNSNLTISVSDQMDTTVEKVVKEDDKTKQVIFLCSNGSGEPEYMTLSVCQEDILQNSMSNISGIPFTSSTDITNDGNAEENDVLLSQSTISSHPSQVSTIPVTNSDQSTETASSISDYLSQSRSALDTNTIDYLSDEHTSAEMTSDGDSLDGSSGSSSSTSSESESSILEAEESSGNHLSLLTTLSAGSSMDESRQASGLPIPALNPQDNVVPNCSASALLKTNALDCQVPSISFPVPLDISEDNGTLRHVPFLNNTIREAKTETDIDSKSTESNTGKEDSECKIETNVQKDCEVPSVLTENMSNNNDAEVGSEILQQQPVLTGELLLNKSDESFVEIKFENSDELSLGNSEETNKSFVNSCVETEESFEKKSNKTDESFVKNSMETNESFIKNSVETNDSSMRNSEETDDSMTNSFLKNSEENDKSSVRNSEETDEASVRNSEKTDKLSETCSEESKESRMRLPEEINELSLKGSEETEELSSQHSKLSEELSESHSENVGNEIKEAADAHAGSSEVAGAPDEPTEQMQYIKEEPIDLTKVETGVNLDSTCNIQLSDPLSNDAASNMQLSDPLSNDSASNMQLSDPLSNDSASNMQLSDPLSNDDNICGECDTDEPDTILPDVNMNTTTSLPAEYSTAANNADDMVGETSPLYLTNEVKDENSCPSSPSLRNKLVSKILPGKSVRQPVRCSPRQSVRAAPCYAQMSLAFAQQKSLPLRVESALQQPAKGRKPCPNSKHGCLLVLPPAQLSSHHLVCEYSFIFCPAIGCGFECIAKKLCAHIREAHRPEIGLGPDSKHTVYLHEVRQQQRLTFLREVSRKLFVISIHAFDNSIFATIQYVASGRAEKPILATGTLEVVDVGGSPHAWRGKIGPIQQRLDVVRDSGNCLQVAPEILGAIEGATITFHTNIRVNGNQSQAQSYSKTDHSV